MSKETFEAGEFKFVHYEHLGGFLAFKNNRSVGFNEVCDTFNCLQKKLDIEIQSKSKMREEYKSLDLLYKSQKELIKSLIKGLGFYANHDMYFFDDCFETYSVALPDDCDHCKNETEQHAGKKARELLNSEAVKKWEGKGD
jgi:hypothetical protein